MVFRDCGAVGGAGCDWGLGVRLVVWGGLEFKNTLSQILNRYLQAIPGPWIIYFGWLIDIIGWNI